MNQQEPSQVDLLSADAYVRRRMAPSLRDVDYPHLTDLAELLRSLAPEVSGDVFDYGCGGAPYRALFSKCRKYVGADIAPGPAVDLVLNRDGSTGEPDASYDLVLSTQVLEHIRDPGAYLRECHRILRPGGQLILTTHGMFEEHGCPFDFYRWTSNGLNELVVRSRFHVLESRKLTTGLRGVVQLLTQMSDHLTYPRRPVIHFLLRFVRALYRRVGMPGLNWFTRFFKDQANVDASNGTGLYVCVYVRAEKPVINVLP